MELNFKAKILYEISKRYKEYNIKGKPHFWLLTDKDNFNVLTEEQEEQRVIGYLTALNQIYNFVKKTDQENKNN